MKITRGRSNRGVVLWVLIVVFAIFIVIIGGIAVCLINCIKRVCPPPPNGQISLGQPYDGGIVIGRAPPPTGPAPSVRRPTPLDQTGASGTVDIYAGDTPWSVTNWIWSGLLADMQTNASGLPVEQWTNGMPPQRFYRFNYNP